MSKTYLRYEPRETFGVISSTESNILYVEKPTRFIVSSGVREILVWNISTGELEFKIPVIIDNDRITCLKASRDTKFLANGCESGLLHVWLFNTTTPAELHTKLNGHKAAVTCMTYNDENTKLFSGSKDSDIIVWDLLEQVGICRLKAHRDEVTDLIFLNRSNEIRLISSSKDSLLKVWDLESQHCSQTIVGHHSAIWSIAYNANRERVITGSSDHLLRGLSLSANVQGETNEWSLMHGSVQRQSYERVHSLQFSKDFHLCACQASNNTIEIYKFRSESEVQRKIKRRTKRLKERLKEKSTEDENIADTNPAYKKAQLTDELELLCVVRAGSKVASFCFGKETEFKTYELIISLKTNNIEVHSMELLSHSTQNNKKRKTLLEPKIHKTQVFELQGHRTDVRAVAISSDKELLLTAGNGAIKLWNAKTLKCLRTIQSGYALCCSFVPGDMHAVVGTKNGKLLVVKLSSGETLSALDAHEGALWSLDIRPDERGLATGSADKSVKFWYFEIVERAFQKKDSSSQRTELDLIHIRTLRMSEDVLCVKYSCTKKKEQLIIAVALLDCTVKIFHDDTMKFALSLYGHKLPVLTMDITQDSTLLITGSADKNIKIWGLDFGDCHKSFFAHDLAVMKVKFVPKTHYFFSCSKDGKIRYWDADKFEMILSIDAHNSEVWCFDVARDGSFLLSAGHDKSLRTWERTQDIVFIEEEREKELEKLFDSKFEGKENSKTRGTESIPAIQAEMRVRDVKASGSLDTETASKRTKDSAKGTERLMEALDLAYEELVSDEDYAREIKKRREEKLNIPLKPKPSPNLLLLGRTPVEHVFHTLSMIRMNELEEVLLVLPFESARKLVIFARKALEDERRSNFSIELITKVVITLIKSHFTQLTYSQTLNTTIISLRNLIRPKLNAIKILIGKNSTYLSFLQEEIIQKASDFSDNRFYNDEVN